MGDQFGMDWSAFGFEEEEQSDENAKGFAYSQLAGVICVLDCRPSMFVKSGDAEQSHIDRCVKCIQNIYQRKVLSSDKDLLALVLYGLNKSSTGDGKAIDVFQDLGQLNIQRITELETILEDTEAFAAEHGHSDNYDMSEVLWTCSNVFAKCNKTLGEKKILLFTNSDNPHDGNIGLKRKAVAKATDLKAMGIELELLALKGVDDKTTFDMDLFYKEILSVSGHFDPQSYAQPCDKFEDLLSRAYKKEHKRRALGRIPFKLGESVEMSVGIYCLCRRATMPTSVKIHSATNSEVRTQTKVFNAATGDDVMPQDIKLYQDYASKRICLDPQEAADLKRFDVNGLKLIGFKKKSDVKLHLHVKPSHFLYPDETTVKGSTTLFTALLSRCASREMVMACWYVARSNSTIELVYLLPQLEKRDSNNAQVVPPGFHVIFCPFKDDVRDIPLPEEPATASEDQVEKCAAVIKKLSFPYDPPNFENPTLQKFYSNLEAMALNRDVPDEIADYTAPMVKKMDKKAGSEMEEFMTSVFPEGVAAPPPKRPAASAGGGAKRAKIDPANCDAKQLATSGELKKLTVADLKAVISKEKIRTSATKKADLIDAIANHFGV